jgi:HSP20 family protein
MQNLATRTPMNTVADPFSRGLGRLFEEAFQIWPLGEGRVLTSAWWPACDVFEERDAVKIVAEIPGVGAEDVKLTLENNMLTLRGEKKQHAEERNDRVHRYERSYGSFERTFALPGTVDPEKIQATYEHGVLTVTLPKAEKARPKEIPVQAG